MSIKNKLNNLNDAKMNLNDVKMQKVGEDVVGFKLALKDVVPREFEKGWSVDPNRHGKCHIALWPEEKEWIVNLFENEDVLKKCGLDGGMGGGMGGFNKKIVEIMKRAVRRCDADGVSQLGYQEGQIRLGTTYKNGFDGEMPITFIALRIPIDLFKYAKAVAVTLDTNNAGLIIQIVRDFLSYHGIEKGDMWGESSLRSRPIRGGVKPVKGVVKPVKGGVKPVKEGRAKPVKEGRAKPIKEGRAKPIGVGREQKCNTRKSSDSLDKMLYEELKVLDHGFIRVMDYMGNDSSITQAARISYGEGTKQLTQDQGLINYLLRNNHTTPFEMCEIKLHIKMPIFIARQWVRHRMAHINEYSARYSILSSDFYAPAVEHVCGQSKSNKQCRDYASQHKEAQKTRELIIQQSQDAYRTYMELIEPEEDSEDGIARELARTVLPVNFYTEMYWKIDLHNFMHFITLRNHPHAQFEIREYARILLDIVKEWVPMTYEAFMQYKTGSITVSKDIAGAVFSDLGDLDDVQKRIVDKNPAISKREVGEFVSYLKALKEEE